MNPKAAGRHGWDLHKGTQSLTPARYAGRPLGRESDVGLAPPTSRNKLYYLRFDNTTREKRPFDPNNREARR
jgi:hypothetical protein